MDKLIIGNNELFHGDCLEVMDKLIAQGLIVDSVIADIPYGTTQCKWDSVIPFDKMWERLNKLIKPNGAILLFGSEPFSSALRLSNIKNYKYDWYWQKDRPSNTLNAKIQPLRDIETISVFYNKQPIFNLQKFKGKPNHSIGNADGKVFKGTTTGTFIQKQPEISINKNPRTLLYFPMPHPRIHPTQKPVALMEYFIKTYTNKNEIVLDFTSGSGTTGVACQNTSRKCVLIEKLEKHFNKGIARMYQPTKMSLFK